MKELLMGNEAVAVGALAAGVQVVSGYPGTPSTEALETIAKRNPGGVYVEWSVNEKAGAEVAAGASYAGARSMVTMKQMGLNVASDPVMCLSYVGVSGGMVIYVADDPGPISSQTEQDTRTFARYSRLPVLDANSPEEAFRLVQVAFDLSEEYRTPVILRATTRVCHSCAVIDVPEIHSPEPAPGFQKDPGWVIFPRLSYQRKQEITLREKKISGIFSASQANSVRGEGTVGIACGGISCSYVKDAIRPVIGSSVANSVPERPAEVPTETPKILQDEEPLPAATEPAKGFAPVKNNGPVKRPKSDVQRKNEQSWEERENLGE